MKKKYVLILFISISMFFLPVHSDALTFNDFTDRVSGGVLYKLDDPINSTKDLDDWMKDYNQEQECSGANSILGDPDDENSVAWLLQQALNYIKIIGPMLVIILSSLDFAKVIIKSDDEAMNKAQKKLGIRLLLAASLFFIPTLIKVVLDIFGITANPTCGLK